MSKATTIMDVLIFLIPYFHFFIFDFFKVKIAALPDAVHPLGSLICQETFQVIFFAFVLFVMPYLPGDLPGDFFYQISDKTFASRPSSLDYRKT